MAGKTKALKTSQGELIKSIDKQIAEQELLVAEINREIKRYWRLCQRGSEGLSGIDYSKDRVSESAKLCFGDAVSRIAGLQANLAQIMDIIADLKKKRKKLIRIYKNNSSTIGKVFYYREIVGLSQEKTAEKLGYSVRQIQRIEKKMKNSSVSESDTKSSAGGTE